MEKLQLCGITERGDPGFDLSFESRLCPANIIITKDVSKIHDILLRNKEKCILHSTITGYGNSKIEPNVPSFIQSIQNLMDLIKDGFPLEQIVLRVDPIFPDDSGFRIAKGVIEQVTKITKIKRLRYSYIDLYPHVIKRFRETGLEIPNLHHSNRIPFERWLETLDYLDSIECCAENSKFKAACISKRDLEILNMNLELEGSSNQRKMCGCPSNKVELLKSKYRCPHLCLYCYWYDKEKEIDLLENFLN